MTLHRRRAPGTKPQRWPEPAGRQPDAGQCLREERPRDLHHEDLWLVVAGRAAPDQLADTTGAETQVTEDVDNRADWLHHNIRNPQDGSVTFVDVISWSLGRALVLANLVPVGTSQGPVAAVWVVRQAWS